LLSTCIQVIAASNDLGELRRAVVRMKALVVLDLSDNVIESLPESVCKMKSLRQLNVADNKIMQFPTVHDYYFASAADCSRCRLQPYDCVIVRFVK